MIIEEWRKFKGWDVLEFFLKNDRKIHLKGLSRELKISPRTAQFYLQFYEKEGVVKKEKIGNIILYNLDTNPVTLEFKKLYFLLQIFPHINKFLDVNKTINTLVLYGSHASGEYDKKSDIDLLAISQNKQLNLKPLNILESKTEKETKIQIFSIGEWKNLINKNDIFVISVLKKHMLLHGAQL